MSNHIHLVVNCNEPYQLKDTIRDFKKFTSKGIIQELKVGTESRKEWMLDLFSRAGSISSKHKSYKVWQTGSHAIELFDSKFTWKKIHYIHENPVRAGLVNHSYDWKYSSASNYNAYSENVIEKIDCLVKPL